VALQMAQIWRDVGSAVGCGVALVPLVAVVVVGVLFDCGAVARDDSGGRT